MIRKRIQESIAVKAHLMGNSVLLSTLEEVARVIVECYTNGGKVLFCGNGGSAADAQHLAAELSGRFYFDRDPLAAEACHVNTSFLTAVSNDYGYDKAYARYIKSVGHSGDVVIGLSTSGNSSNIVNAFEVAEELGMKTVAFTGQGGGKMGTIADFLLDMPSDDTPRIQEAHILVGHIICEIVESAMFSK